MAVFFFLEPLEIPGMFLHLCRMKVNKHNLYFFDAVTENLNGKNQAAWPTKISQPKFLQKTEFPYNINTSQLDGSQGESKQHHHEQTIFQAEIP